MARSRPPRTPQQPLEIIRPDDDDTDNAESLDLIRRAIRGTNEVLKHAEKNHDEQPYRERSLAARLVFMLLSIKTTREKLNSISTMKAINAPTEDDGDE
jgi:hypothetical protein